MSFEQTRSGPGPGSAGPDPALEAQQESQHHLPQHADPSIVKLTRGTSCVLCQQRKVRCDKSKPCANCVKAGVECRVVPPQPPRRRKKRLHEKDLVDRLKKYEALLAEHGVKFDAIGHSIRADGPHLEDLEDLENDFEELKTSPPASSSPSATSHIDKPGRSIFSLHREFRASEQLLHDSSDDEADESTIHRAFDKMFSNNDGFPFVFSGRQQSTTHYHPSTIHIFQLWQLYIDNVNPLLKITHAPSIQSQIIQASSNLESAPKNLEALMFGIYCMAITSLDDAEVEKMLNRPKKEVLAQFFEGLQQALLNAGLMRYNDFLSLQAYVLYLFAVRWFVDPRQVFCLIGIAVRIAQRMGLHRDPAGYGLPPFEVEQRRRLWWTIVSYDRRIGEMTGSTITGLSSGGDCKLPLNVNDSDLHVDGKELPSPHNGPTEMLFALTRLELAMAVVSNSDRDSAKVNPDKPSPSPSSGPRQPPSAPTIRIAGQDSASYTLEGFCAHMEGTYLQHCDPKIPLHFFTLTMTRQALSKMRVINYLMRMYGTDEPLNEAERDNLFLLSVQMVEYDNAVHSSDALKPFKWFTAHHFPFPAYMFLIQELRRRCSGAVVERAWGAIAANHALRGLMNNLHSPMHAAFGRHFIKAWDAHAEACVAGGDEAPAVPAFIAVLRERADARRRAKLENRPEPHVHQQPYDLPRRASPDAGVDMMTPPSVGPPLGSSAASSIGIGDGVHDASDMDWSYLVNNFQPGMGMSFGDGFQGFDDFGPFAPGPGIGRMGGLGGPGPGGMY
ncbi:Aurofusarin cluster transcription factor [Metarhizium brunneum]|uniref:Aurofusarin cluster transcription factor n=1 Tax=Metarhizium brunneum TaxID=500148 RepID=A0A7D5YXU7_9HYPO|nr:Aurofusarin cluster transcription factor [Metarhizium brunneum]